MADPIFVSVNEALQQTSLGRTNLYSLMSAGKVRYRKQGRRTLIEYKSLLELGEAA